MTLEQKIGQFFFPAAFINDSESEIQALEQLIREYHIGGLTFFHSRASAATNYESKKQVILNDESCQRLKELIVRYQKCASTPLLISIDAEWGLAMRVEKTPQYPYAITLGALPLSEKDLVYQVGKQIGTDLKEVGIHYNLAPLADINNNPDNPVIGYRSFGEDKEKVAQFALAYLQGLNDAGILGCLKHFPGHGNTNVDSHLGLPVLTESLEELMNNELHPFAAGIAADVDSIMIGHLAVPALNDGENTSATLSQKVIEGLLRTQMGFEGLVISDALNMHSVSKLYTEKGQLEWEAFQAGNDVLCFAENIAKGIQFIKANATIERIDASYNRILKYKKKAGLFDTNSEFNLSSTTNFDWETTSQLNTKIAQNSITTLINKTKKAELVNAIEKKSFAKISLYGPSNNLFFTSLESELSSPTFTYTLDDTSFTAQYEQQLQNFDTLLISLFVPKAKPLNNFELEDEVLHMLKKLLETKKCTVYVFGNPYSLQVIPSLSQAKGLVMVYQDFKEFQEAAAQHFLTNTPGKGTLPVHVPLS